MKRNDNVKVIELDDEDVGYGIEEGTTGVIIKEDYFNNENSFEKDDIFFVKLNCKITGIPVNLEEDGTYQFYRRQLEEI